VADVLEMTKRGGGQNSQKDSEPSLRTLAGHSSPTPAEIDLDNAMKADHKFPIDQTTALRRVDAILDGHRQRLETATGLKGVDMVKELRKEFTNLSKDIRDIVQRCSGADGCES
jgi:hypothetical protein